MRSVHARKLSAKLTRAAVAAAALAGAGSTALGQVQLTWSPLGLLPGVGGPGIWDTSTDRWDNAGSLVAWNNANNDGAAFTGGPGVVLLPGALTAGSLDFGSDYRLFSPQLGISTFTTGTLTLAGTAPTIHTRNNRVELIAPTVAASGLTKLGSGMLIVHGFNNVTGSVNVNAGTLAYGNTAIADFPSTAVMNIAAGAAVDMGNWSGGFFTDTIGDLTGAGNVFLGTANGLGVTVGSALIAGTLNSSATTVYSGSISGGGRFSKQGAGTLVFSGVNTYTGPTSVEAGTLRLDGGAAMADTNAVFVSNVAGVRLLLGADETIGSIGGGGTTGGIVDTGAFNLTIGADNTFNGFAGTLAGSGKITKVGTGLQAIQNTTPASTFTGKYDIRGGTFSISGDTRLGPAPGALVSDHITLSGGVFSNSAAGGMTLAANRGITVVAPSGLHAQGVAASNFRIQGPIVGSGDIRKTGLARLTINGTGPTFTGGWNVTDGQLATESLALEPFGTGSMRLNAADLVIAPAGTAADNLVTQVAQGSGNTVHFGPGSVIQMNRGVSPTQRIVLGNSSLSPGLVRDPGGTLVFKPTTAANLGTPTDQILITGAPVLVNGIMPGVVATNNTAGSNGHLVNYDNINGVVVATYSSTDLSTSTNTDTVNQTTNVTLTGPSNAYALRVGDGATGVTVNNAGQQIVIGNGVDPAMLVINKNSVISGGSINFGTSEGVIFAPADAGTLQLNSTVVGQRGIHKIGDGALTLATPANHAGRTRISGGTLIVSGSNFLPVDTELELLNIGRFNLNGQQQTVAALNGSRGTGIHMGLDGKLTVGAGSGQFLGSITNGTGATTSTITKDGPGVLTLGEELHTTAIPSGTLSYNKLAIRNGGVVAVSAGVQSLPLAAATVSAIVADNISLDGGTLRIQSINSAAFGSGGASTYTLSSGTTLRGIQVGPNGGTIEVSNPKEIVIYQRGNGGTIGTDDAPLLSGSGVMTKTGPGFLRLGIGNTGFTGKWVVKDGNIQFQDDRALGADPSSLVADYITLDGGMLQSNGSGTIGANRGITVAAGGGRINNGGPFLIFSPLTGSGPLEILQGNATARSVQFNAQSPTYSGVITLVNGRIDVTAANHGLGTGTIEMLPKFNIALSKTSGANDTKLGNNINFHPGSTIDIRVDSGVGSLILAGNLAGPNTVYKSSVGAAGTFAAGGQGTLVLSGNNSFTGDLVIKTGAVVAESPTALGSPAGATIVYPGTALAFQSAGPAPEGVLVAGDNLYIAGTGISGGGALVNIAGTNTNTGDVLLMQDATVNMINGSLKVGHTFGPAALNRIGSGTYETESIRARGANLQAGVTRIASGVVPNAPAKVSDVGTLSMAGGAVLDLSNNAMVVRGETLSAIEALVDSGHASGSWTGSGINSSAAAGSLSTAIGVASGADFGASVFLGRNIVPGDVLLRYVRYGDANLSGTVDIGDFAILGANFNLPGRWGTGDFNYDGLVNLSDFSLLGANFNLGVPGDLPRGAAVPEPATAALVALGGALMFRRRR